MGHQIAVRRQWAGIVLGVLFLPACVEPLRGSNIQFDFAETVPPVGERGVPLQEGQAPADTFFTLYAADLDYVDADGDGRADLDMNGEPLIETAYLAEVHRFEIRKLIDTSSPCFIDLPGGAGIEGRTSFPGLHITQHANKTKEVLGIPLTPGAALDPTVPRETAVIVLTAERRMDLLPRLENEIKAVTSSDATVEAGKADFQYPATSAAGTCGGNLAEIPHPTCTDDASNALRLQMCQDLWAEAGSQFYEGSDKVFTLPLNGQFYGLVEGMNPVNEIGLVGGSGIYVDENLVGRDAYVVNYQYKDLDGDGAPDTPAGVTPSALGFPYLFGRARTHTRGVQSANMRHPTVRNINAELAVFAELGEDDVQF